MKTRRGEVQVFSISFLDVISCALGGTLLLLLLNMQLSHASAEVAARNSAESQKRAQELRGKIDRLSKNLDDTAKRATDADAAAKKAREKAAEADAARKKAEDEGLAAKKEADDAEAARKKAEAAGDLAKKEMDALRSELDDAINELESISVSLVGLQGEISHVVFLFDTSGSMIGNYDNRSPTDEDRERFRSYKKALQNWIRTLKFDRFNVVQFGGSVVRAWHPRGLTEATQDNRDAASKFITSWNSAGNTPTLEALKLALAMKGVKRIVLFSDGEPSDAKIPEILRFMKKNASEELIVDAVGMGNYFNREYGEFLQDLAKQHNGVFIGR